MTRKEIRALRVSTVRFVPGWPFQPSVRHGATTNTPRKSIGHKKLTKRDNQKSASSDVLDLCQTTVPSYKGEERTQYEDGKPNRETYKCTRNDA